MELTNKNFGQYRILRLLGRGGMGEVYEAEHTTLQRRYALKLLPEDFASRPEAVARFRREAAIMANLEHAHIVRVDDFGESEGCYWLRMELVKGVGPGVVTLGDYAAQKGGKLEPGEFALMLEQILEGLAYAHSKEVVHRDLKPGNILLDKDAAGKVRVKISDFGLARVMGEDFIHGQAQISVSKSLGQMPTLGSEKSLGDEPTLREKGTSTRALLGTWEYMSPEQKRREAADARSDVYAVGLMCFRLLTAKELGLKMPSRLVPGLRVEWDEFVSKALEQESSDRYANGGEMLAAFAVVQTPADSRRGEEAKARADAEAKRKQLADEAEKKHLADEVARREAERLANAKGSLLVNTAPTGAMVTLGGEGAQQSPARFKDIQIGKQLLRLSLEGYEPVSREVQIKENDFNDLGTIELARLTGMVRVESTPSGAMVKAGDREFGKTPLELKAIPTGEVNYTLALDGYQSTNVSGSVKSKETLSLVATLVKQSYPGLDQPWVNTLGMKYVALPGTRLLFGVWDVRVRDYRAFAEANSGVDGSWRDPGFEQGEDHPVVRVSWHDARAFCAWLTQKERSEGKIGQSQSYRLPTDAEWSVAVGLNERGGGTPKEKSGKIKDEYPWGGQWPPPIGAGNYDASLKVDNYVNTSPVGSFAANRHGLHDLGGNVWQWCEDWYDGSHQRRVLRGASWLNVVPDYLLSSYRFFSDPADRSGIIGFRCVVVDASSR